MRAVVPAGHSEKRKTTMAKVQLLCDRCRKEFEGDDWMEHSKKDILCDECYAEEQMANHAL